MQCAFAADLWVWDARKSDSWTFVTVPAEHSDDLRATAGPPHGFGSIRVEVRIGTTTWRTSVFPDTGSGCYVLPVKAAVRRAEGLTAGDTAQVALTTV